MKVLNFGSKPLVLCHPIPTLQGHRWEVWLSQTWSMSAHKPEWRVLKQWKISMIIITSVVNGSKKASKDGGAALGFT